MLNALLSLPAVAGECFRRLDVTPFLFPVEKQNHTLRMHCRRLARLTNAFSKKLENFKAAVALHYAYYNFVKSNIAIRCTPAMAAGVTNTFWTVRDLVEMVEG